MMLKPLARLRRAAPAMLLLAGAAHAQGSVPIATLPVPQNVVSLAATASIEVTKDWLTVVFSTTRDGADASAVQSQLKQALDAALAEAKKGARPGQLEVSTGGFSLMPRYGAPNARGTPVLNGWQGSTELVVEGRDAQAIAQLTSRITTLTIARVGWSLSREAREKVQGDAAAMAIARFRANAETTSRQFGFAGYTLREVNVATDGAVAEPPMPRMRVQAMRVGAEDAALPTEAGKTTVNATVSGSVQMTQMSR